MAFIEMNLGEDVKERDAAPEGEYTLVVSDVYEYEKGYDDGGKGTLIRVKHDIESDDPDSHFKPVYNYLSLPREGDDQEKIYNKTLMIKRYLSAAGIPFEGGGFNSEDLYGARFTANLSKEVFEETGEESNRLDLPRLAE